MMNVYHNKPTEGGVIINQQRAASLSVVAVQVLLLVFLIALLSIVHKPYKCIKISVLYEVTRL